MIDYSLFKKKHTDIEKQYRLNKEMFNSNKAFENNFKTIMSKTEYARSEIKIFCNLDKELCNFKLNLLNENRRNCRKCYKTIPLRLD